MSNTITTTGTLNPTQAIEAVRSAESLDDAYRIILENRGDFDVNVLDSASKIADAQAVLSTERERQAKFEDATRTLAHVMLNERDGQADALAMAMLGMKGKPREGTDNFRAMKAASQSLRRASKAEAYFIAYSEKNGADALTDEVKRDLKRVANAPFSSSKEKADAIVAGIAKTGKVPSLPKPTKKAAPASRSGKVLTPNDRRSNAFDAVKAASDAVTALIKGDLTSEQKRDLKAAVSALSKSVDAVQV
jgi:hypothetical protein